MFNATPRLKKKSPIRALPVSPPIRVKRPKAERIARHYDQVRLGRLRKFQRYLDLLASKHPHLASRFAECLGYFADQYVARPVRTVVITDQHRAWIRAHPEHAALELFRLAWNQHEPFVNWPEEEVRL